MPNIANAIGKTLFAVDTVEIKRQASDSAPAVYTAKKGESIGTVQGYLEPNASRTRGYFSFRDKNGNPYYTVHDNNLYDKKFDAAAYVPDSEGGESTPSKKGKPRLPIIFLIVSILLSVLFWYFRKKFKFKI